ncbi:MAG: zinc ribbon domain-containing protein [Acidobacteria bacterium]|nr:zinc ribbon domain-containing protein [Acidobacteriota bacterium]
MMHCPQCGQQQVSEETKFCSRCGFQLGIVGELLHHGGTLPQLADIQRKKTFFNKKNGVVFSVIWFIFFTMFLTSIWGIVGIEELAGVCAVTGVFGALTILISSLVMLPSSKSYLVMPPPPLQRPQAQPAGLYGTPASPGLPPQRQEPAGVYHAPQGGWRAPDTGDLVERGSVIENTTKLLKRDEQ